MINQHHQITLSVKTQNFPIEHFFVTSLDAYEAVNVPYQCRIECLSPEAHIAKEKLLNTAACVTMSCGGALRYFHGFICEFMLAAPDASGRHPYAFHIVPELWYFDKSSDCHFFHNKTVPEILQAILQRQRVRNFSFRLIAKYEIVECCMQYKESILKFMTRIMEAVGIYCYYEHTPQGHKLIFADHPANWKPFTETIKFCNVAPGEAHLKYWQPRNKTILANWVMRDYHFPVPKLDLTSKAKLREPAFKYDPSDEVAYYEYPGGYSNPAAGAKKLIEHAKSKYVADKHSLAQGDVLGLAAGDRFKLADVDHHDYDGFYAILEIHHSARQSADQTDQTAVETRFIASPASNNHSQNPGKILKQAKADLPTEILDFYRRYNPECLVTDEEIAAAVAHQKIIAQKPNHYQQNMKVISGNVRYYPPHITKKPKMPGVQTAIVVGPDPDKIYTDKYGRIKANFNWEYKRGFRLLHPQLMKNDPDRHSCWMRVSQLVAGPKWGGQHLPRPGQEVVVAFDNGNPDKPIAVGALYNGDHLPPFPLPAQQAKSGIRSHSYKTGKKTNPADKPPSNELIFDDTPHAENITISTAKDLRQYVKDSETMTIGEDHIITIEGDALTEILQGCCAYTAGQSIELTTGSSNITITADGIELNAPSIHIETTGGATAGGINTTATYPAHQTAIQQTEYAIKLIAHYNNKPQQGFLIKNENVTMQAPENVIPEMMEPPQVTSQNIRINQNGVAIFYYPQPGSHINGKIQKDHCNISLTTDIIQTQLGNQSVKRQPPWQQAPIQLPTTTCNNPKNPDEAHTVKVTTLWQPITKNYRTAPIKDADEDPDLLSAHDLEYYKTQGNATIFIHGFNIAPGDYSQQIMWLGEDSEDIAFTGRAATTFRDIETVKEHFPDKRLPIEDRPQLDDFKEKLNGTGVHNWWLSMEDNLNRATGQFNRKNYLPYTRVINIAWHGNPKNAIDYVSAIDQSIPAGKRLAKLIKQLKQNNIEINIIAHSLGNSVLIQAMNELGKQGRTDIIDHTFFWEAAIPNNALSDRGITTPYAQLGPTQKKKYLRQEQIDPYWYLPYAHLTAKNITILYSQNDNILGPIPKNQHNQKQINHAKPFTGELVPALFIQALDWESIYTAANWVGVPVSDLFFSYTTQEYLYKRWLVQHPGIKRKNGQPFSEVFAQQIKNDAKENQEICVILAARFKKSQAWFKQNIEDSKASWIKRWFMIWLEKRLQDPEKLKELITSYAIKAHSNQHLTAEKMKTPTNDDLLLEGVLTLLNTMFIDANYAPRDAMGYWGRIKVIKPSRICCVAASCMWSIKPNGSSAIPA